MWGLILPSRNQVRSSRRCSWLRLLSRVVKEPQKTPTIEQPLSRVGLRGMRGMSPAVKPMTRWRPSQAMPLWTSLGSIAAVHQDCATGHKAGIIRSEPDKRFGNFLGRGEALQGMAVAQFLAMLLVGCGTNRSIHITPADRHDTDMERAKLQGCRLWETQHPQLGP